MDELSMAAQDRRLVGRRLHFDGREWTVLYTDMATRMTLPTAGLDLVLEALRAGTIILQTEPTTIAAQGAPVNRDEVVREWLVLDATIAGAQAHGTLPEEGLDVLEGRLAILTAYLSRRPFEPPVATAATRSRPRRPAAETRILVKPISTKPTILVVDDDPSVRDVMRRSLEREGYRVLVAEDGMAGARQWRAEGADLVIVDILMPEMDGIELLVQLRTKAPRLPILVISGGKQTRNLDLLGDANLLGATAVLEKPISIEELSQTVARLLRVGGGRHHSV